MSQDDFAYLTTTGRISGKPHTIEIWYCEIDGIYYLMSGGGDRSDWYKNFLAHPQVLFRLRGPRTREPDVAGTFAATARVVTEPAEADRVRRAFAAKYHGWQEGEPLSNWALRALPVAIERNTLKFNPSTCLSCDRNC